jgi:hypothetical protein
MTGNDSEMLGRFLVGLHSAKNKLASIRATITHKYNPVLGDYAACRHGRATGQKKQSAPGARDDQVSAYNRTILNVWMVGNRNVRVDGRYFFGNEVISFLTVSNGTTTLERRSNQGSHVTECTPETAGQLIWAHRHFDAATITDFLSQLEVWPDGVVSNVGQDCVRLRCVPRNPSILWPHWLPFCADEYEFYADAEHSALLQIAGYTDGRLYEEFKVTEVGFGEPVDPVLFSLDLEPGETLRVERNRETHVGLDKLAGRVAFLMYLPKAQIMRDLNLSIYRREYDQTKREFRLCYVSNFDNKMLRIHQTDQISRITTQADQYLWTKVSYDGREFQLSDPGVDRGERIISLLNGTTYIEIASTIELDKLADIARSLEPVALETEWNSLYEICSIK